MINELNGFPKISKLASHHRVTQKWAAMICPMSPDIIEAIRHEHNATLEAVQRAQARALHLGEMLLQVRDEFGKAEWEFWLQYQCPIPAGVARRYANEAKRLKRAA